MAAAAAAAAAAAEEEEEEEQRVDDPPSVLATDNSGQPQKIKRIQTLKNQGYNSGKNLIKYKIYGLVTKSVKITFGVISHFLSCEVIIFSLFCFLFRVIKQIVATI